MITERQSIRRRVNKLIIVLAWTALVLLLTVIAIVFIFRYKNFDVAVFSFAKEHTTPANTRFMQVITFLGNHSFLIPANILLLAFFILIKERQWAIRVAVVSLSSIILMAVLKNIFQRARPDDPIVTGITNFGFPSGHGMMAVVFYGLMAGWIAVTIKNRIYQRTSIAFLILLVLFIGYSRIYLRVHYATDVLAGYCVGMIWLTFCLWTVKQINNYRSGLVQKKAE